MKTRSVELSEKVLHLASSEGYNALALEIFHFQRENNPVYAQFLQLTGKWALNPSHWTEIPCLPVSFFKSKKLFCGEEHQQVYTSSGTTGAETSRHYVADTAFYHQLSKQIFELKYGPLKDLTILALLPGYLERKGSSLIAMVENFITQAKPGSGFFLHDHKTLAQTIIKLEQEKKPFLLLGVTYALLDFAEQFPMEIPNAIIMETGGMKGKRKEMIREEIHSILCKAFSVKEIHSEYGMTEMLSQAYSKGQGVFTPSPTLRIRTREITDPFCLLPQGKSGSINIYDLGNIDSVSFIAIDDLGKVFPNEDFEILGRIDNSDIRGCNLLVQ